MEKVIDVSGLTKRYGEYTAVNNLNLTVNKGEIFGLLGPNGAGKSTTILMLLGLSEPSEGIVRVCGIDPVYNPIQVKRKVGYLPEDVGFYDDYTGLENLIYTAKLNNISKEIINENAIQVLHKVGLKDEMNKKVGKYSRGMRQRLGFADVLIKNPEIIILDEPTLGIDPVGIIEFLDLIVQLSRKEGITVLFSSHHLHQVQKVCDRVGIFVQGKLLAEGNIDALTKKLFSSHAFTLISEIVPLTEKKTESKELLKNLNQLENIIKVHFEKNILTVESKNDNAAQISQIIVNSGFGIKSMSRKVYGLDEIYHQYFQGHNAKNLKN